ncbi:hypothetical protein H257_14232 [Aphanomyces astaci]|uniref:Uncharacterized protein n=1 Tax=Aphanomyces astaci TaxID=112090 RepID=W4FTD9_APHAT|nr:hypothetical protein H257_14232 [Aphanomyces astaci]ETV70201.1 hypothetical protein H257_14232 [Aphanomyces astaci]|eukprot:XP_009840297.1 hypothetical protein H257_14232 [Aphanomyces astaci]
MARDALEMPTGVTVSLSVKIGVPLCNSRSYAKQPPTSLMYDTVEDSFASLRCRISDRVQAIVVQYDELQTTKKVKSTLKIEPDFLVLVKPSLHTKQSNFTVVHDGNFIDTVKLAWTNHCMKATRGDFALEVFEYLEKIYRNPQQLHRATTSRRAEMSARILAADRERQSGPATLEYLSSTLARQVAEPDVVNLPSNATIRQLEHIDDSNADIQCERRQRAAASMQEYREVRFQINDDIVHIRVNVSDFSTLLGLPGYDLYAPFRAPIPTTVPLDNISDCDHKVDSD